jgi:23S rRNA (guanosine2251-2'-O)-methyltransferase
MDEKNSGQLIYGIRPVLEAIAAGKEIEKVLLQNGLGGPLAGELKRGIREHGIVFQYVPAEKLNRVTGKNHQGVIAYVSSVEYQTVGNIVPMLFERGETPLLIILDRVTDVRNFGAIARSAECMGVHAIVIPSRGSAQINSDAVKTSAGALHHLAVCREHNLKDTIDYLKESGIRVIACTEKTERLIYDADFSSPCAILLGSEENGVSPEYLKRCDDQVRIPLSGKTESLNVSVAAGVAVYEAVRQRRVGE